MADPTNPKSITGAWRAFSDQVQADIATAQTVTSSLYFAAGDPMEPEPETYYANEEMITGQLVANQARILTKKMSGSHKNKLAPHEAALFMSICMGKCTTSQLGATAAYLHKLETDKTVVELKKRTMVEYDGGASQKKFIGVACSGFKISGKRGENCEFEATLMGTGDEAADVMSQPARVAESYLAVADAKLYKGGTFDGTAVTGGTEISAKVIDFELDVKNGAKATYLPGDTSGKVGSLRRDVRFTISFKASLEISDTTEHDELMAGTEFVMRLPIVGGVAAGANNYTIEPIFPRLRYKAAKKGVNDGVLKVAAEYLVLADATYGPLVIRVINLKSTSYLA